MGDRDSIKQRWYKALLKAYQEAKPIDSLTSAMGKLSVDEAYDVQAMLVENRIRNGERVIGWKVGGISQIYPHFIGINKRCVVFTMHPLRGL